MVLSKLDRSLGGILAGSWASSMLFMLEILQVFKYLKTYPSDSRYLRAIVLLLFTNEIISEVAEFACVYLYCVTHWGDIHYLTKQYWPIQVYVVTSGCSAAITQTFLVYRVWCLSSKPLISIFLLFLVLTAFAGSIALTVVVMIYSSVSQRSHLITTSTIWIITGAVADICIAIALIWQFWRIAKHTAFPNTRSLIHRLVIATIKTGSATSIVALIIFLLYIVDDQQNFALGIAFSLGRIYSLTMLVNLNARNTLKGAGQSEDIEYEMSNLRAKSAGLRHANHSKTPSVSIIHVVKTVHIEVDAGTENGSSMASLNYSKNIDP